MDPHDIAVAAFLLLGVITFLTGMLMPVNEEAYEQHNEIKKGIPQKVQKIKLIGVGSLWVIAGILMLLKII
ncbi:MAG: hypothetical protein ACM3U0_01580 [archaeon]